MDRFITVLLLLTFFSYVRAICTYGDVRLVGGPNSTSGRVEVCANNQWGTVCDDYWDNNNAKVVCRMLNYSSYGAIARGNAYFGQGNGSILLDDVQCTGNETSIFSCYHSSIGSHDCRHSEDAGVVCLEASTTSNILGAVIVISLIIGSILLIIIISIISYMTVVIVRKCNKSRRSVNPEQIGLETTRSPRTIQTETRSRSGITIPQAWNPCYVTESEHNFGPPPPYNPHYYQQSADSLAPLSNLSQPSAPPHPYDNPTINTLQLNQSREVSTMIEPSPPSYDEL